MLKTVIRILFLGFGLVLLLDALLPDITEHVAISRHYSYVGSQGSGRNYHRSDNYVLEFDRGLVKSCGVSPSLYTRLKDGDELDVSGSRFFKTCTRLRQGSESLRYSKFFTVIRIVAGIFLILGGLGAFGSSASIGREDRIRDWDLD